MKLSDRYKAHREQWDVCEKCPLHENAYRKVHYRGSLPCDILFIGEGPGTFEDYEGKPFVGPAGILLDQIIRDAHNHILDTRPDLLDIRLGFCNVVACLPVNEPNTPVREPMKAEVMACRPRLQDLRAMANPKGIVLVGKTANKYVPVDKTPRLFIVHPAAMLRMQDTKGGETNYVRAVKTAMLKLIHFIPLTVPKAKN